MADTGMSTTERKPMTRYRKAGALLFALGLVAAACGDDDDDDAAPAATDAPATDAPATDAPATDAPATDAPATDAPATGEDTAAAADPTAFDPADLGATLTDGEYGENYVPDPQLLVTGMGGPAGLPEEERARNIVLATVTRAGMPVDEELAMKCWNEKIGRASCR